MTTRVSQWTTAPGSAGIEAPTVLLQCLAARMETPVLPIAVWPLVATVVATKLTMLAAIVWASPELTTGALVAALDIPLLVVLFGLLSWLLRSPMRRGRAAEGR